MRATRLYPILDESALRQRGARDRDLLEMWARGGVTVFQYRAKDLDTAGRRRRLQEILPSAASLGLQCIINDDFRLYTSEGLGHGFHIGHEDWLALGDADRLALRDSLHGRVRPMGDGVGALTGISTHTAEQVKQALLMNESGEFPLSYVALGPCFPTTTKTDGLHPVVSAEMVAGALTLIDRPGCPDLALIGGIEPATARALLREVEQFPSCAAGGRARVFLASIASAMDPQLCQQFWTCAST